MEMLTNCLRVRRSARSRNAARTGPNGTSGARKCGVADCGEWSRCVARCAAGPRAGSGSGFSACVRGGRRCVGCAATPFASPRAGRRTGSTRRFGFAIRAVRRARDAMAPRAQCAPAARLRSGSALRERADIRDEPERIAAIRFVHEFAQRAAARERRVDVADGGEPRAIVDQLPREVSGDARDEAKEVDVRLLAKTRKAKGTQGCVGSCSPAHAANRRTITRPDVRGGLRDAA